MGAQRIGVDADERPVEFVLQTFPGPADDDEDEDDDVGGGDEGNIEPDENEGFDDEDEEDDEEPWQVRAETRRGARVPDRARGAGAFRAHPLIARHRLIRR